MSAQKRYRFQKCRQRPRARSDYSGDRRRQSYGSDLTVKSRKQIPDLFAIDALHTPVAWVVESKIVPEQGSTRSQDSCDFVGYQPANILIQDRCKNSGSDDQVETAVVPFYFSSNE